MQQSGRYPNLGGFEIVAKVNAKAARKLASWTGGAVLHGRLIVEGGNRLTLAEAAAEGGGE